MSIEQVLEKIESQLSNIDKKAANVSAVGVDWQLHHSLLVIKGVLTQLLKSDPKAYRWRFNLIRAIIFGLGQIPRGKGRAPDVVKPKEGVDREELEKLLQQCKELWPKAESLAAKAWFAHPVFGALSKKQTFRFLDIHSLHHLKIVEDIVRSSRG